MFECKPLEKPLKALAMPGLARIPQQLLAGWGVEMAFVQCLPWRILACFLFLEVFLNVRAPGMLNIRGKP
jgi:hypothetical protein